MEQCKSGNNNKTVNTSTQNNGVLDANNSTSVPLLAGEKYTGTGIKVTDFVEVIVSVFSDVGSAVDGLQIQYSSNNTEWDHSDDYTVPADTGKNYSVQRVSTYYRIVYTNGTTDQLEFRLTSIQNKVRGKPSSHKISNDITTEDDAELNTSVLKVSTNDPTVYRNADVQNPLVVDGDSVYAKDLDIFFCTAADFIKDADPTISEQNVIDSMVSDIYNEKLNSTADAVKTIFLQFKRPILTSSFGINSGPGGDFSNVKITLAQGDFTFVVFDGSADPTKYQIFLFPILPVKFSRMTIEFFTTDPISIGLIGIFKNTEVAARIQAISDLTDSVEDVGSFKGALNVNTALVHSVGINEYFRRDFGGSTTFASAVTSGDTDINVASAVGFAIGNFISLSSTTVRERSHFHILNIVGTVFSLNRPIDNNFDIGDAVTGVDISLSNTGTIVAPISSRIAPPSYERWQITRLLITMLDSTAMDDGKFGGAAPLTNGLVLRISKNGIVQTATHWNANQDLKDDMYNVDYADKAPAGLYGLNGRWTITAAEFVADLDGATGDYAEILNQDGLTVLDDFKIKAQGRLFGG